LSGCSGIKGFLKITPFTDFPERFLKLKRVYLFDERKSLFTLNPNDEFEFRIEKCEVTSSHITIKFEGINSKEEAAKFVNYEILIPEDERLSLPKGKYFHYEIIGFDVYYGNDLLGRLEKIDNYGSHDLLNVKSSEGKEILIPYRDEFVKKIDAGQKRIDVELIEGFLD
jgi:16S rRNA processing protein RimM